MPQPLVQQPEIDTLNVIQEELALVRGGVAAIAVPNQPGLKYAVPQFRPGTSAKFLPHQYFQSRPWLRR